MNQILASLTRTERSKDLFCNLGSLGLAPCGAVASLQVGASLTFPETQGRNPYGFIKQDTTFETDCQEGRTCAQESVTF